uniref:Uncharacterized protein n=1 Tax=Eutreptiella gymnastica TaxID=73025 RepID=A0A7S4LCU4_9EUGL
MAAMRSCADFQEVYVQVLVAEPRVTCCGSCCLAIQTSTGHPRGRLAYSSLSEITNALRGGSCVYKRTKRRAAAARCTVQQPSQPCATTECSCTSQAVMKRPPLSKCMALPSGLVTSS